MIITLPLDPIASFATEHPLAGGQPVPIVDAAPIGEARTPLRGVSLGVSASIHRRNSGADRVVTGQMPSELG
jgi:hypothetical protein